MRMRARIIEEKDGEPRWEDISTPEEAIKLTDKFCFHGWYRLNIYEDGKLLTAVRPNPSDFGAPIILGLIKGEAA